MTWIIPMVGPFNGHAKWPSPVASSLQAFANGKVMGDSASEAAKLGAVRRAGRGDGTPKSSFSVLAEPQGSSPSIRRLQGHEARKTHRVLCRSGLWMPDVV
ncbi:hypothetical protein VTJ04DRAFT_9557 [Mycothermus thermophilus]|uniref:uncharacterized protein n=1 Tax=Humicola insolens TaxID=85995 RepID=UPI003742F433